MGWLMGRQVSLKGKVQDNSIKIKGLMFDTIELQITSPNWAAFNSSDVSLT